MKAYFTMKTLSLIMFGAFSIQTYNLYEARKTVHKFQALVEITENRIEAYETQLDLVYKRGYLEGVKSINVSKVCTSWWFGGTSQERIVEARKAHCKGNT
jgi:hypothetical protein